MTSRNHATIREQSWLWVTAVVTIIADQWTKYQIEATLPVGRSIDPVASMSPILDFTHVHNTGAAFGTLQGYGWIFTAAAFLVAGYLLFLNYVSSGNYWAFRITLGLILGGAMGNVIDRFRLGHVTDFIHFNFEPTLGDTVLFGWIPWLNFYVFNYADVFIVTGVIALMLLMWTDNVPEEMLEAPPPEPQPVAPRPRPTLEPITPIVTTPFNEMGSPRPETENRRWQRVRPIVWVEFGLIAAAFALVAFLGLSQWRQSAQSRRRRRAQEARNRES